MVIRCCFVCLGLFWTAQDGIKCRSTIGSDLPAALVVRRIDTVYPGSQDVLHVQTRGWRGLGRHRSLSGRELATRCVADRVLAVGSPGVA